MFTIAKMYRFEASHSLPNHKGQCANDHGHSYRVWFYVEGEVQESVGFSDSQMVMDYGDLSRIVRPLLEKLDHSNLNVTAPEHLQVSRTTAEALARGIYQWAQPKIAQRHGPPLTAGPFQLAAVRVSETRNTWAEYRP